MPHRSNQGLDNSTRDGTHRPKQIMDGPFNQAILRRGRRLTSQHPFLRFPNARYIIWGRKPEFYVIFALHPPVTY